MHASQNRMQACDQGDAAFQETFALLFCIIEACASSTAIAAPEVGTVLRVVRERLNGAREAFDRLAQES